MTDENDINAIREIILSKNYFRNKGAGRLGHCNLFEKAFAEKMNTKYSLMVTSGTNALICALTSLDLKIEDEVIMPSFTYFATAVAVIRSGGTPVIVNIDESLMIDPIEVEKAITKNTKAIIVVHMDGHPCDMLALKQISEKNNLILIEDTAQACGGSFHGKKLGSIGDIGCFSFNVDKIISCGEGGAVITNNQLYYEKSLCIQDACCSFGPTFKESFTKIEPFIGQSMRVSEISGALMNVQLSRLDLIIEKLKNNKKIMADAFLENNLDIIPSHDELGDCGSSIYLRFDSANMTKNIFVKLAQNNILTFPIANRYAHACWQWMHLIEKERPHIKYHKTNYLTSIDLLSHALKINVPFDSKPEEISELVEKTTRLIKS